MHKDLRHTARTVVEVSAHCLAQAIAKDGQSLALAREAWINAFDKAAAELDA